MALTENRKHGPLLYTSNENFPGIHLHLSVLSAQVQGEANDFVYNCLLLTCIPSYTPQLYYRDSAFFTLFQ